MNNIMGFSSKVSLSHKKKAIKSLEKLYEENDSFQDCKIDQRTNIYVHNSFQESLGDDKIKEIKTSSTLQTDKPPSIKDYLQFLTIYPYYLGKYGFSLKEKQKIFIGPFLLKDKKELRVDTNINPLGMPTFAFQTGEYIRKIPKKQLGGARGGSRTEEEVEEAEKVEEEEAKADGADGADGAEEVKRGEETKEEAEEVEEEGDEEEEEAQGGEEAEEVEEEGDEEEEEAQGGEETEEEAEEVEEEEAEADKKNAKKQSFNSTKSDRLETIKTHFNFMPSAQQRQSSHSGISGMQSHLRVLEKKINTMESSIMNTNSLGERIRELEFILKEIDFPKKKKSKELYTIFMLPSYETIKKEKNLDFIKMFIHGGDKKRKDIIQGLFGNEPVFNLLNNHFETAVIKPTSTLKFQYFFGFKNLNEAKKEIKTKELSVKAEIIDNNDDDNNKNSPKSKQSSKTTESDAIAAVSTAEAEPGAEPGAGAATAPEAEPGAGAAAEANSAPEPGAGAATAPEAEPGAGAAAEANSAPEPGAGAATAPEAEPGAAAEAGAANEVLGATEEEAAVATAAEEEAAAEESTETESTAKMGGSKRRRKYRIKKKSKNTKKRIRFTLKEKTKKNKYLRILKKRNRKKKQQFTNRAMYKRRSLTRCTRKRV